MRVQLTFLILRTMKNLLITCGLLFLLTQCQNEIEANQSSSDITGTWKLIAVKNDIGNGLGTFVPATTEKVLIISADGKVVSSVGFCPASNSNEATYNTATGELKPQGCDQFLPYKARKEGDNLILTPGGCIEECGEKYVRVRQGE